MSTGLNQPSRFCAQLESEGANILSGGKALTGGALAEGFFCAPTLAEAAPAHPLWQKEMFLPITMIAPIITTPCMALAPLIKGVCKTEGTLEITSMPKKTDRITTYNSSMLFWMKLSSVSMNAVFDDR